MNYLFSRVSFYKSSSLAGVYRESARALSRYPHSDVDPARTHLNVCLCEEMDVRENLMNQVKALCASEGIKGRISVSGPPRSQSNVLGQALFKVSGDLVEKYGLAHTLGTYRGCLEWFRSQYPTAIILSAYVHLDEPGAGPHMHVNFLPVAETSEGVRKLSSSELFSGRQVFERYQSALHGWATERYPLETIPRPQAGPSRRHLPLPEYKRATAELSDLRKAIREAETRLNELTSIIGRVEAADALGRPLLFGGYKLTDEEYKTVQAAVKAAEGIDYQLARMQDQLEDYRRRLDNERIAARKLSAKLRQYEDIAFSQDVCYATPSVDLQAEIDRFEERRDMHNKQKAFDMAWLASLER